MKNLLSLSSLVALFIGFAGTVAQASIVADIRCETETGGFAFDLTQDNQRVWLTDGPTDLEGVELEVTNVTLARCPGCYLFEAQTEFEGEILKYTFNLRAEAGSFTPTRVAAFLQGEPVGEFSCLNL